MAPVLRSALLAAALTLCAGTANAAQWQCSGVAKMTGGDVTVFLVANDRGVVSEGRATVGLSQADAKPPFLHLGYPLRNPQAADLGMMNSVAVAVVAKMPSAARTASIRLAIGDKAVFNRPWQMFAQAQAGQLGEAPPAPGSTPVGLFGMIPFNEALSDMIVGAGFAGAPVKVTVTGDNGEVLIEGAFQVPDSYVIKPAAQAAFALAQAAARTPKTSCEKLKR